jgi:hypothetical protein
MRMMNKYIKMVLLSTMLTSFQGLADDLDDGIEMDTYIEDEIRIDINRSFIKQSAIGGSGTGIKGRRTIVMGGNDASGAGNINIGAGTDLSGATIINLSTVENTSVLAR